MADKHSASISIEQKETEKNKIEASTFPTCNIEC